MNYFHELPLIVSQNCKEMKQWLEPFVLFSKLWNKCRVRLLQVDQFFIFLKIRVGDKKGKKGGRSFMRQKQNH